MEIFAAHTNVIVPGVLRRGNYKRWNIFMRHYLLGQDLWDIVQSSHLPAGGNMRREWIKKSALALHAIKISCGEDLETKDYSGSTALSIAARYGIGKSIAQKLVGKNYNLLTIPDNDGKIPVELACTTIREDLTRYLYRETPLQSLNVNNGVRIIQECITRKMFDTVFDLLHHFSELASRNYSSDSIPLILILAQTPPPFFKESNLSFWRRSIYNCIRILEADVIKEDKHRSCAETSEETSQDTNEETSQDTNQDTNVETNQETNQDTNEETNLETNEGTNQDTNEETNQELQELSFIEKCDKVFDIICCIIGIFLVPLILIVILPPFLVRKITGALRQLVSILSRCFGTDLYETKLMDEYARKVIRLICHQTLSELDQNQFVQSRAVEATFYAIKNGIPDIVEEITKANANILWSSTDPEDSRSRIQKLFALAVKHRQEEVAHLLYESEKEKNMLLPPMKMEIIHYI